MNGSAENETIVVCRKVKKRIHPVIKDADFTGDAAGKGLVPDPRDVGADSLLFQRDCRFRQSGIGAAQFVGTAVDQSYFHRTHSFL